MRINFYISKLFSYFRNYVELKFFYVTGENMDVVCRWPFIFDMLRGEKSLIIPQSKNYNCLVTRFKM